MRRSAMIWMAALWLAGCGALEVLPTADPSAEPPPTPIRAAPTGTRAATQPLATQAPGAPTPTARPAATAIPAATSSLPKVTPAAGKGNVDGSIVWNGAGAADQEVKLCEEFQLIGGCKGREYITRTNPSGAYRFAGVDPGEYALAVRPFGADSLLYITSGAISARKFTVEANKTLDIRPQNIYRLDLTLGDPKRAASVTDARPTLSWAKYPSADYYEVYFTPGKGDSILVNAQTRETSLAVPAPLLNCEYRWNVSAYNVAKVKIAASDDAKFTVSGQAAACLIALQYPPNRAPDIAGAGLRLEWTAHPLAVRYEILMWNDTKSGQPKVLDFTSVNEAIYPFKETLEPARYVWTVYALDKDGKKIAASDTVNFTVSR